MVTAWIETPGRGASNGRGEERITPCGSVVITKGDRAGFWAYLRQVLGADSDDNEEEEEKEEK